MHKATTPVLNDRLLTETEAAAFLGIRPATLRGQRCQGTRGDGMPMIPFVKMGGRYVRYLLSDLTEIVKQHRVEN